LESDEEVLPAAVLLLDELDGLLDLVVDAADEAPEAAEAFTAALPCSGAIQEITCMLANTVRAFSYEIEFV